MNTRTEAEVTTYFAGNAEVEIIKKIRTIFEFDCPVHQYVDGKIILVSSGDRFFSVEGSMLEISPEALGFIMSCDDQFAELEAIAISNGAVLTEVAS